MLRRNLWILRSGVSAIPNDAEIVCQPYRVFDRPTWYSKEEIGSVTNWLKGAVIMSALERLFGYWLSWHLRQVRQRGRHPTNKKRLMRRWYRPSRNRRKARGWPWMDWTDNHLWRWKWNFIAFSMLLLLPVSTRYWKRWMPCAGDSRKKWLRCLKSPSGFTNIPGSTSWQTTDSRNQPSSQ